MKLMSFKDSMDFIEKNASSVSRNIYNDASGSGRTMTLFGPDVIDPNFVYTATIRDSDGGIEYVFEGTLEEIYRKTQEVDFHMPTTIEELQNKSKDLSNKIDALCEKIYQNSLDKPYWKEVSDKFKEYNANSNIAEKAAQYVLNNIIRDYWIFFRVEENQSDKVIKNIYKKILAGLT